MDDQELEAMQSVMNTLSSLTEQERDRVITWVAGKFGISLRRGKDSIVSGSFGGTSPVVQPSESIAEFFDRVHPENEMERALTVAAFLQKQSGKEELGSQEINDQLKHLGFPVSNITAALSRAMDLNPRLIHQVRKSGTSQQARKKYKVTMAGFKFLEDRASGDAHE